MQCAKLPPFFGRTDRGDIGRRCVRLAFEARGSGRLARSCLRWEALGVTAAWFGSVSMGEVCALRPPIHRPAWLA